MVIQYCQYDFRKKQAYRKRLLSFSFLICIASLKSVWSVFIISVTFLIMLQYGFVSTIILYLNSPALKVSSQDNTFSEQTTDSVLVLTLEV